MEELKNGAAEGSAPGADGSPDGEPPKTEEEISALAKEFAAGLPDLSSLKTLLSGIGRSDPREGELLRALKPYLGEKRRAAVDAFLNLSGLLGTIGHLSR